MLEASRIELVVLALVENESERCCIQLRTYNPPDIGESHRSPKDTCGEYEAQDSRLAQARLNGMPHLRLLDVVSIT